MMKKSTIILLLIFGCGDTEREVLIKNDSGSVVKKYTLKNGEVNGEYSIFYPSGKIKVIGNWSDNKGNGRAEFFYETGELREKVHYRDSALHGTTLYYYKNSNVKYLAQFDIGERIGISKLYYEDGSLSEVKHYHNGELVYIEKFDSLGIQILGVIDPIFSGSEEDLSVKGIVGLNYAGVLSVDLKSVYPDESFKFTKLDLIGNEFFIEFDSLAVEFQVALTYTPAKNDSIHKHRTITKLKLKNNDLVRDPNQEINWVSN